MSSIKLLLGLMIGVMMATACWGSVCEYGNTQSGRIDAVNATNAVYYFIATATTDADHCGTFTYVLN